MRGIIGRTSRVRKSLPLLAGLFLFTGIARASIIVSDNFSEYSTNGQAITGTSPSGTGNTNLPGGSYTHVGSSAISLISSTTNGNAEPSATNSNNGQGSLAISLASNFGDSYVKPVSFTVSADLYPGGIGGSSNVERGIGIGFYSATGSSLYTNNLYTGFVLDAAGNLSVIHDTTTSGFSNSTTYTVGTVAYGGTFNANAFYTLTYTVNTTTGNLSNISLRGSTASYDSTFDSTTAFAGTSTNYLGLYVSSTSASAGYIDNVSVQTVVPEPAACGLILSSVAGLLRRRNRHADPTR